ncbi:hypothetical protein GCM10020254_53060 [Streptomyces goshikiensis]
MYAQMAVDVGTDKVKKTAISLGIPENTPNFVSGPAMALGTMQASVLDMTQAYATLADHGRYTPYTLVEKITKEGDTVKLPDRTPLQVVSREAADTTTSMLVSVVDNGTGTAALAAGHPAAGKTGTAEQDRAAWFAGYTPDLVTVVSMMGQDPDTGTLQPLYGALGENRIGGGGYPARIWAAYTKTALEASEPEDFDLELEPGAAQSPPPAPAGGYPGAVPGRRTEPRAAGTVPPGRRAARTTAGSHRAARTRARAKARTRAARTTAAPPTKAPTPEPPGAPTRAPPRATTKAPPKAPTRAPPKARTPARTPAPPPAPRASPRAARRRADARSPSSWNSGEQRNGTAERIQ